MFDYFPSAQRVVRSQIDVWLHMHVLRLQATLLVDIGTFFYTPEMTWSTANKYRCAELSYRWILRLQTIDAAQASPVDYLCIG